MGAVLSHRMKEAVQARARKHQGSTYFGAILDEGSKTQKANQRKMSKEKYDR